MRSAFVEPDDEPRAVAQTVTGTTPSSVVILRQRFSVSSWRDVAQRTIADLDEEGFDRIVDGFPTFVSRSGEGLRSFRKLYNGTFMEVNLSAPSINEFCIQAVEVAGLSPDDWYVEVL